MIDAGEITPAMQDYLEAMLSLAESTDEIRVTDVAAMLHIAKATVAQGIDHLKKHGLVVQEKYGPVELTASGQEVARDVRWKHYKLKQFLIDVLDVDPEIAEDDACLMEHAVSTHTMTKLLNFLEPFKDLKDLKNTRKTDETIVPGQSKAPEVGAEREAIIVKPLGDLKAGERGKVIKVVAGKELKSRILDMGITPGAIVLVKGFAPLGDPVEVVLKGYHLTLRKDEASQILVEMGV
jgi:DtxR family Mn-dependent transcriptional regulator